MNLADNIEVVKRRLRTLNEIDFHDYDRSKSIGGSEVSCILGLNNFKSAYRLWLEKTGMYPSDDLSALDGVHFGSVMEPVILSRWMDNNNIPEGDIITKPVTFQHPLLPWMSFSPDGYQKDGHYGVEIKFVGYRMLRDWGIEYTDEIPTSYLMQVAWGAVVTRIKYWYIVAQIGTEMRTYVYEHRPELAKQLIKSARRFIKCNVKQHIAPPPSGKASFQGRDSDIDILKFMHPSAGETIRNATPHERALLEEYNQLENEIKPLEKKYKNLRAQLEQSIGDDKGITSGKLTATWKQGKALGKRTWGFRREKKKD